MKIYVVPQSSLI